MFLDTSGLLCYQDTNDHRHERAVTLFQHAPERFTHNYVLVEYVALCQARGYNRRAALQFSNELLNHPFVDVVWVDLDLHLAALRLLKARADKSYSLCDAVSFVLMEQRGLQRALTTDHHFTQEGFHCLLAHS